MTRPFLLGLGTVTLALSASVLAQVPFRSQGQAPAGKRGATKRVALEMANLKGACYRKITTLDGAEFAVRALSVGERPSGLAFKSPSGETVDILVPLFSTGDTQINIRIDPAIGFTEFAGLKILDAVVVTIASDGTIEADRAGVRARAFDGSVSHAECFLAAARSTDSQGRESFSIAGFSQPPAAADGSMARVAGETLTCKVELKGRDGESYVSQPVARQGETRFVFLPAGR